MPGHNHVSPNSQTVLLLCEWQANGFCAIPISNRFHFLRHRLGPEILRSMFSKKWYSVSCLESIFATAGLIACLLLPCAVAQTLQVTSQVAVWPAAPVDWEGVDGVAIANSAKPVLLPVGDWLLATSSSTRVINITTHVDRITFDRRSSRGVLQWQIQRAFTNTSLGEVAVLEMVVTRSGLFHALVGWVGRGLWTGTVDGVLLREDTFPTENGGFIGRMWGLYADQERLTVSIGPDSSGRSYLSVLDLEGITERYRIFGYPGESAPGFVNESAVWSLGNAQLTKTGTNGQQVFARVFRSGGGTPEFGLNFLKWLGDKVLVGGWAMGSAGNDLSRSFGLQDAWLIWTDIQGGRIRDGVYGGVGSETLKGWVPTEDGGFLLAIDSRGSGVSGNKTIDGDGVWLVKISPTGAIQGQRLIPNQLFLAIGATDKVISLLVRDAGSGKRVQSIQIGTEVIAKIRALAPEPFDLLTSTNLHDWRVLGTRVLGEVEFSQPAREGAQFYRMIPAQR